MKEKFLVGAAVLRAFSGRLNATGVTIQSGTTFNLQSGTSLSLPDGSLLKVTAGGTFRAVGTSVNPATVSVTGGTGGYFFIVDSAGTINTKHSVFSGMDTTGIFIRRKANITAFDSLTLRGGVAGHPLLWVECTARIFTRIEFDSAGLATYNVKTTADAEGNFDDAYRFSYCSGDLGGDQYDSDPGDRYTTGSNSVYTQGWITWGDPLSVELIYFSAISGYEEVTLVWESSSETGSRRWLIERAEAEDGNYENIMELRGLGTSPSGTTYTHIDDGLIGGITYWYRLTNIGEVGEKIVGTTSATPKRVEIIPFEIRNYPNPFMNNTVIRFGVPGRKGKGKSPVSIIVYDIAGRVVKRLSDGEMAPDFYTINWDGRDNKGRIVGSGVYFLRFDTEDQGKTLKLIRVRR